VDDGVFELKMVILAWMKWVLMEELGLDEIDGMYGL
jgi:hypothetical protein